MNFFEQTRLEVDGNALEGADPEAETIAAAEEAEEEELATELLGVSSEEELDQFLGGLLKKAKKLANTRLGKSVTGYLKAAAKKALPALGTAVGAYFGGPAGAQLGGKLAAGAGSMFGLELEGLSPQDAEFELAKSYVRFARAAADNAAALPASAAQNPAAAAKRAVIQAARQHAPGLLRASGDASGEQSGRWVRQGNRIVLYGA